MEGEVRVYFQNMMSPARLCETGASQMRFEEPMPTPRARGIARWGR